MAVTGSVFVGFLLFHMAGNLKVYISAEDFDHYAEWLRGFLNPLIPGTGFLWLFRAALALCLVCHVYSGLTLWLRARRARGLHSRKLLANRISSRTMIYTGLVLLCFIVFHLLDLTTGTRPAASDKFVEGSAYANLVYSFDRPLVAGFYALTMLLLALHLSHGIWSLFNDFGATGNRLRSVGFIAAGIIALVVVLGNLSIPIAVQAGYLTV
jgi:succinate dehydrogenase / fumarate reductase cytochrome b subunit